MLVENTKYGIHTGDIYRTQYSKERVGTKEFADAVIERLGQKPSKLKPVKYNKGVNIGVSVDEKPAEEGAEGIDVFIDWIESNRDANVIGDRLLSDASTSKLKLKLFRTEEY